LSYNADPVAGHTLHRKLLLAVPERNRQHAAFKEFTESVGVANVQDWTVKLTAWEADKSKPNPYICGVTGITEADVKQQLADEEKQVEAEGAVPLHEVGRSEFIVMGLGLEESQ
jgi:hypothetical protein